MSYVCFGRDSVSPLQTYQAVSDDPNFRELLTEHPGLARHLLSVRNDRVACIGCLAGLKMNWSFEWHRRGIDEGLLLADYCLLCFPIGNGMDPLE